MPRTMLDAAYPQAVINFGVPRVDIVAGYIGLPTTTPHIWTDMEWLSLMKESGAQYKLPIFVRANPSSADPHADAKYAINWATMNDMPKEVCIALDFETAVNPAYVSIFSGDLAQAGWLTLLYGSKGSLFKNPKPPGGYWVADPTGQPHLYPGSAATQWSLSGPFGGAYDPSLVADTTPLWRVPMSATGPEHWDKADWAAIDAHVASAQDVVTILEGTPQRVGLRDVKNLIETLPDLIVSKLPAGTGLTIDQAIEAVKDALREGTGTV